MKYPIALAGMIAATIFHAPHDDAGGAATEEAPPFEFTAHPIVETEDLELRLIVIDAGTQARSALDEDVMAEYTTVIKDSEVNPFDALPDDQLPQVFRDPTGRCVLADGFTRYGAHKKAKAPTMRVAIREGTQRDALIFSLGANQSHGQRRTNKDKIRAVRIAVNDPEISTLSNMEIARICGVSESMIREARPAIKAPAARKVARDGKIVTMDTAAIGKGKGGGKKGAKAAKAAAKKSGKNGASSPAAPEDKTVEIDKLLSKIADAGGAEGGKLRAAVLDGALPLPLPELRALSEFSKDKIKSVLPLVTGGPRLKPTKAFDFIGSLLSDKIQEELHNRALGSPNGKYSFEGDGFVIECKIVKKS